MKVNLKCFSTLTNSDGCDYKNNTEYELNDTQTVRDLADCAGIGKENVKIVFLNSKIVDFDAVLSDGDQIGFVPPVGGM